MEKNLIYNDTFLDDVFGNENIEKVPDFFTEKVMNKVNSVAIATAEKKSKFALLERFEYIIPVSLLILFSLFVFFRESVLSFLSNLKIGQLISQNIEHSVLRFFRLDGFVEMSYVFMICAFLIGFFVIAKSVSKRYHLYSLSKI